MILETEIQKHDAGMCSASGEGLLQHCNMAEGIRWQNKLASQLLSIL